MRVVCLVYQPVKDDLIVKVLQGEQAAGVLNREVKAAVRLEMAGVRGIARVKNFTYNLSGRGSDNSHAIFMANAGR